MIIPEYNDRIIADPAARTKVDIQEPKEFQDTSFLDREAKTLSRGVAEAADVFTDMKKQRDQGIVNEFMNEFGTASADKIAELKQKYKGRNSGGIIDAYKRWQDDYYSSRIGFSQENEDGTLYLENNEQIEDVRNRLQKNLASEINSLSSYSATELNDFAKQQYEGQVYDLTQKIAKSDSYNNINIYSDELSGVVNQYYKDSPDIYKKKIRSELLDKSYASNIDRRAIYDPIGAMSVLQDKDFQKKITAETWKKSAENTVNSLIAKKSDKLAMQWTEGFTDMTILSESEKEVADPIVKLLGKDTFEAEVYQKAREKQATLGKELEGARNQKINREATALVSLMQQSGIGSEKAKEQLSQLTTNMAEGDIDSQGVLLNVTDINNKANLYHKDQELVRNLMANRAQRFNEDLAVDAKERQALVEARNRILREQDIIKSQAPEVSNIMNDIYLGKYKNINQLLDNDLHPVNKEKILNAFASAQKYKELEADTRGRYDLKANMQSGFKSQLKVDAADSTALYGIFQRYMKDEIITFKDRTGEYPHAGAEVSEVSQKAYTKMLENEKGLLPLIQISEQLPSKKKDIAKSRGFISMTELNSKVRELVNETMFKDLDNDDKETLAKYINGGNLMAAQFFAQEALDD